MDWILGMPRRRATAVSRQEQGINGLAMFHTSMDICDPEPFYIGLYNRGEFDEFIERAELRR